MSRLDPAVQRAVDRRRAAAAAGSCGCASGTSTQTLRPSRSAAASCSCTNARDLVLGRARRAGRRSALRRRPTGRGVRDHVTPARPCAGARRRNGTVQPRQPIAARYGSRRCGHAGARRWSCTPTGCCPPSRATRAIARRLYDAVRDLPIISPHGHVDPRLLLDDEPFPDPATLFVTPDHYVTRLLHADGVAAGRPRRRAGRRCPRTQSRQVWRLLCAHWHALPRHAGALLARGRAGRDLRRRPCARRRRRPTRSTTRSPSASAEDAFRPAGAVRAVRHRGAGHHRRPVRRPGRARRAGRRPGVAAAGCIPTFRPDRYLEPAPPGWARRGRPPGRGRRRSTPATTPATSRRWRSAGAYFIAHGAVSADHSHADVAHRAARAGRGRRGSTARRWPATATAGRGRRPSAGTCCWRWPGCRATTAW